MEVISCYELTEDTGIVAGTCKMFAILPVQTAMEADIGMGIRLGRS